MTLFVGLHEIEFDDRIMDCDNASKSLFKGIVQSFAYICIIYCLCIVVVHKDR